MTYQDKCKIVHMAHAADVRRATRVVAQGEHQQLPKTGTTGPELCPHALNILPAVWFVPGVASYAPSKPGDVLMFDWDYQTDETSQRDALSCHPASIALPFNPFVANKESSSGSEDSADGSALSSEGVGVGTESQSDAELQPYEYDDGNSELFAHVALRRKHHEDLRTRDSVILDSTTVASYGGDAAGGSRRAQALGRSRSRQAGLDGAAALTS